MLDKKTSYMKIIIILVFQIIILSIVNVKAYATTKKECISTFERKYGETNSSVDDACAEVSRGGSQGIMWFNSCISYCPSGINMGSTVAKVKPDNNGKVIIGLHTMVAMPSNITYSTYFYAGHFEFKYNNITIDHNNYTGISATDKLVYTNGNTNSDWSIYKSGSYYKVGQYLSRGSRSGTEILTTLNNARVELDINEIRKQINQPKGNIVLKVYRCYMNGGDPITSESPIEFGRLGTCGEDASTLEIEEKEDTVLVSTTVKGRRQTSPESTYSEAGETYIDSITNGDPSKTDKWDIKFTHKLTINGTGYEITEISDCPSGYTCNFGVNKTHDYTPSLSTAGSITLEEKLTVTQNSTGKSFSSSAYYQVSKSTKTTTDGHDDGNTQSDTIIYTATCTSSESNPTTEIAYDDGGIKTITYSLINSTHTNYSSLPLDVQNSIISKQTSNGLNIGGNLNQSSKDISNSFFPGETKIYKYNGFVEKIISYSYKMRQNTETTEIVNEDGTTSSNKINKGDAYPIDIETSDPVNGNNITCPEVEKYRQTKFYEYNSSGDGVKVELNGETKWGTENTTASSQATTTSIEAKSNTEKLYTSSNDTDLIKLSFKYYNTYHFYQYTIQNRLNNLKVVWWKNNSEFEPFEPTSVADTTEQRTETIEVKNINGAPNTGSESEITLGTYDKEVCRTIKTIKEQIVHKNTTNLNDISEGTLLAEACAHIYRPWNYNLSFASIQTNGTSDGQVFLNGGSGSIKIVAEVNNDNNSSSDPNQVGNASYSPDTKISLYSFTIDDGTASTISDINAYIHSKIGTGTLVTGQTQTKQFDPESTNNPITFNNVSVSGSIGTHLCFYATMNYTNSKNDTTRDPQNPPIYYDTPTDEHTTYSEPTCFTITSIPTAQIRGGSLYAEGDVRAKVQFAGTGLFGSWVDYGLISNGEVSNFASGKAIKQTGGTYDEGNNSNHPLTVANYNGSILTSKGKAKISSPATKSRIVSLYSNPSGTVTPKTGDINISDSNNYTKYTSNQYTTQSTDTGAKYRYTKVSSESKITQSLALDAGITHVIYSNGDITINSNIMYEDDQNNPQYAQITDIPQFIIIAKGDINIEKSVTEINAWLIADGTINTCTEDDGTEPAGLHQAGTSDVYHSGICDNALTVNGPVFAKNILLERTGINFTSKAAEVFNITAANYYWAFAKAKEGGTITTVYNRALAPRR